jgi:hypothetical protein
MSIYTEKGVIYSIGRFTSYTPLRPIKQSNAFVIVNSTNATNSTTTPDLWKISAYIDENGILQIVKGANSTATGACSYTIVSCDKGEFTVQLVQGNLGFGDDTVDLQLDHPVDLNRSFIIGSSNCSASGVSVSGTYQTFATFYFNSDSSITAERINVGASPTVVMQNKVQAITWASWTGVVVDYVEIDSTENLSSKVAKAHGIDNLHYQYTWLVCHPSFSSSGLEQCSITVSFLDGSGVPSDTNIYIARNTISTSYYIKLGCFFVRFPIGSIFISHVDATQSTSSAASKVISPGFTMLNSDSFFYWTNNSAGTGNGFARQAWINAGYSTSNGNISSVNIVRGYVGQVAKFAGQFIAFRSFTPQNPAGFVGHLF